MGILVICYRELSPPDNGTRQDEGTEELSAIQLQNPMAWIDEMEKVTFEWFS
jgi:hypothetical protein